jgi:hypothetical protein
MNAIPDSITEWLQPAAKPLLKFKRVSGFQSYIERVSSSRPALKSEFTKGSRSFPPQLKVDFFLSSLHFPVTQSPSSISHLI